MLYGLKTNILRPLIEDPTNNQLLMYNSDTKKWYNVSDIIVDSLDIRIITADTISVADSLHVDGYLRVESGVIIGDNGSTIGDFDTKWDTKTDVDIGFNPEGGNNAWMFSFDDTLAYKIKYWDTTKGSDEDDRGQYTDLIIMYDDSVRVYKTMYLSDDLIVTDSIYGAVVEAPIIYLTTNNSYGIKAKNSGGTWSNIIKLNSSNNVEFGQSVELGIDDYGENPGIVTPMGFSVTSGTDTHGFGIGADWGNIIQVLADGDGAGGVEDERVVIDGFLQLDSLAADPDSVNGVIWYGGGDDSLHIWTNSGKMTIQLSPAN